MYLLIDDFLKPEIPPEPYVPDSNVVTWCPLHEGYGVLEVFRRNGGTYGYQYQAWVAWRDAGDEVQGHGWYSISPRMELFIDSILEACALVSRDTEELCLEITAEWANISPD